MFEHMVKCMLLFLAVGIITTFLYGQSSHISEIPGKTGEWEIMYQKCSVQRSPQLMSCHCFVVVLSCWFLFCCSFSCCCRCRWCHCSTPNPIPSPNPINYPNPFCCHGFVIVFVLLLFLLIHYCFGLFCCGFVVDSLLCRR